MIGFLIAAAVAAMAYTLSLMGRRYHPQMRKLRGWLYAHRGLHGSGRPENSMAAFSAALERGYGIELDIHLMKDGNLAVIHDASLLRTADADVRIEDLTTEDLKNYPLEGTQQLIPLFSQVLELYAGKAPLIVELKPEGGNQAALCEAACKLLEGYKGAYCIESFHPACIAWLKKNRPEEIRGQLAENFFKSEKCNLPWHIKFAMTSHILNFLSRPDFIAYRFSDRNSLGTWLCRKLWGIQGVSWTIKSKEDLDTALKEGWIPIFEGFEP